MRVCPSCGASVADEHSFCTACGADINAPSAAGGTPAAAPSPAPAFDVGDVVGTSVRSTLRTFMPLLRTAGIPLAVAAVLSLVVSYFAVNVTFDVMSTFMQTQDPAALVGAMAPILGMAIGVGVVSLFFQAAAVAVGLVVARSHLDGQPVEHWGEAWQRAGPRYGNLLLTVILFYLAMGGIMLVGVVLGILVVPLLAAIAAVVYLAVRWAVAAPVSVFEDRHVTENLRRSSELTRPYRSRVFGAVLVAILIVFAVNMAVGIVTAPLSMAGFDFAADPNVSPEEIFASGRPSPAIIAVQWVFSTAATFVTTFFLVTFGAVLYDRLRPPAAPAAPPAAPPTAPDAAPERWS